MQTSGQASGQPIAQASAQAEAPAHAKRAPRGRTKSRDLPTALIEAAETVLVRDGARAVTVRAVAAEAGVAPMGVYNRFGSKDGLIDTLLLRGFTGLRNAIETPGVQDAEERLHRSGMQYREYALANRQHYALMFEGVIAVNEFSSELGQMAVAAFGALVAHVEFAMAAGVLAQDDPMEVAQEIWSAVHGAVSLEIHDHCPVKNPAKTYEKLLRVLVNGLRATGPETTPAT